jgi:translocation protein SEC63
VFFYFAIHFPEAHTYFVESISKAYQALTDPTSRENYEKYGHPDGRQVMNTSNS